MKKVLRKIVCIIVNNKHVDEIKRVWGVAILAVAMDQGSEDYLRRIWKDYKTDLERLQDGLEKSTRMTLKDCNYTTERSKKDMKKI